MTKEFDEASKLILWNKQLLSIGGLWPLEPKGIKFYALLGYSTAQLSLSLAEFEHEFGNLEIFILNLSETGPIVTVLVKMLILRYSNQLEKLVREILTVDNEKYICVNNEERRIYTYYSSNCVRFFKVMMWLTFLSTISYFIKPMQGYFSFGSSNVTSSFVLPYRINLFFNITEIHTYFLVYGTQFPMLYVYSCYTSMTFFIWSLVFHVCGILSILAFRIRNVGSKSSKTDDELEYALRDLVEEHSKIIWAAEAIDDIFKLVFFDELILCTLCLGLSMYNMLANTGLSDFGSFLSFIFFVFTMLLIMYGYCITGDCLIQESMNVREAYFECEWYNMPLRCQKVLIICMIRAQNPLYLTAGGFYIYSLEGFTSVVKTALAYVSMLRQVIQ